MLVERRTQHLIKPFYYHYLLLLLLVLAAFKGLKCHQKPIATVTLDVDLVSSIKNVQLALTAPLAPAYETMKSFANDKFSQGPPRIAPSIRHFLLINYC